MDKLLKLWHSTGLYHIEPGQLLMIVVCLGLIYLAIRKGFEPLLLIPIGFGGVLANIPVANMAEGGGSSIFSTKSVCRPVCSRC